MMKVIPRPYWALMALYLIWGTTIAAMRFGVETIPPGLLICSRYLLGGGLLLGLSLLRGESFPSWGQMRREMVIGFLILFAGNTLIYWAVQYIPTGLAGIIMSLAPFWMVILAAVIPPREYTSRAEWLGLLIGFIGICILFSPKLFSGEPPSELYWWCVGGMILMNIIWAVGSIFARKTHTQVSMTMGVGLHNLTAGICAVPLCLLTTDFSTVQPSLMSVLGLGYLVLFGTSVALPCYFFILRTLPIPVTGSIAYVTPVITLLLGAVLFGEPLDGALLMGGGIILAGVAWTQLSQWRWSPPRKVSGA